MSFSENGPQNFAQPTPQAPESLAFVSTLQQTNQVLTALLAAFKTATAVASYYHINSAGTFLLKGSAGTLLSLNINNGAGSTSSATIYDSAGTASLPGSLAVAAVELNVSNPLALPLGPEERGLALNSGIVVVTVGTADITLGFV